MQLIIFLALFFIMFFGFLTGHNIEGAIAFVGLVAMCVGFKDEDV